MFTYFVVLLLIIGVLSLVLLFWGVMSGFLVITLRVELFGCYVFVCYFVGKVGVGIGLLLLCFSFNLWFIVLFDFAADYGCLV